MPTMHSNPVPGSEVSQIQRLTASVRSGVTSTCLITLQVVTTFGGHPGYSASSERCD